MAKYFPLSPYADVVQTMDAFIQTHHAALSALMIREYKGSEFQRLREMNLTIAVETDGRYLGMINVNIINEKFSASNLGVGKELRFENVDNPSREINGEWFKANFFDERDRLKIQLSFKQFVTDTIGLPNVTFSSRYLVIPSDAIPFEAGKLSREDTSPFWDDPAMVLAGRKFFAIVKPLMEAWTPSIDDITTQIVAQF